MREIIEEESKKIISKYLEPLSKELDKVHSELVSKINQLKQSV